MNIKWNADKYAADFSFVYRYGEEVMQLLELPQGAEVIDLGCGNGALSQVLADKGYSVTGIDASAEQLALARKAHPDIRFIQADATSFTAEPADAVFSNGIRRCAAVLRRVPSQQRHDGSAPCRWSKSLRPYNPEALHE